MKIRISEYQIRDILLFLLYLRCLSYPYDHCRMCGKDIWGLDHGAEFAVAMLSRLVAMRDAKPGTHAQYVYYF